MKNTFKKLAVLTACLFTGASTLVLAGCDFTPSGEVTDVTGLTAKSIAIAALPTKTTYNVGEKFDKTGIKVVATFTNGQKGDVSDLVSFSNTEFKTAGKQTILVAYQTATASFEVTITSYDGHEGDSQGGEGGQGGQEGGEQGGQEGGEGGETEYTESDIFPAEALQEFLTTLGLTTTVPAPTGVTTKWYYTSGLDMLGNYVFEAYTEDAGTPGTDAIEDSYKEQLTTAGWTIDDTYYEEVGYYADKGDVTLLFYTYEGEFVIDVQAASTEKESDEFPAEDLQTLLTAEGLTTTVPSPVSSNPWAYDTAEDEDGSYFYAYTEDAGTPGTNAIEDTYKTQLTTAGWTIDDSKYEDDGYYANKGDVEILFYSYDGYFQIYVYAGEGGSQGGGDTPVTPSGDNDGTLAHPYTVSEAWTIIDALEAGKNNGKVVYVTGTVTGELSYGKYGAFFDLTDGTKTIVAYSIAGVSQTEGDDNYIAVGDTVVVSGALIKYNASKYEVGYVSSDLPSALVSVTPAGGSQGGGDTPVTPTPKDKADWTIMIYMCGSDLETDNGFASADISEILSVAGQPDDVNIIIETGGSSSWKGNYGIANNKLGRYHVSNGQLVKDTQLANASMGATSTLQSFLTWGLTSYPADKVGVILWNHGGAMEGVCSDENYQDEYNWNDTLLNSEAKAAFANAIGDQKLEFIGYDACLMQVQDIAEFNSQYFNYMIASEESEAGYGWDYDNWVDDLYAKKSTEAILKEICDTFIAENDKYDFNDQTLSYLDLSKMASYKSAFESFATSLNSKIQSANYGDDFVDLMKTVTFYGSDRLCAEDYEYYVDTNQINASDYTLDSSDGLYYADYGYDYFGTFDVSDFLDKVAATSALSGLDSQISAVRTVLSQLVKYSVKGDDAANSNGLCLFFPAGSLTYHEEFYTTSETNFTNWRSIVTTYGVDSQYA